eukprot:m.87819 g.87819  ORF g.87819 m.87819 type:complete len:661 (+) comp9725_c0_seq1:131-2113(+)
MAAAPLEKALATWAKVDLASLQATLDAEAEAISSRRDTSDDSRKALMAMTKQFRSEVGEDIRKAVKPLMMKFQAETDSLNKRAKKAEEAFYSVYAKMAEAPDPTPLLESALQRQRHAAELEVENEKLSKTVKEYHAEFAAIKNQEVTVKRLQEKLEEYEERMDDTTRAQVAERERQLQREFEEKERELQEARVQVATQLGDAEQKAATLRDALDATQSELFDMKAKYDEDVAAKDAELEMLSADLDRANQRVEAVQKELATERDRMASQQLEPGATGAVETEIEAMSVVSLEKELARKELEINQLIDNHRELQRDQVAMKQAFDSRIQGYDAAIQAGTEQVAALKKQLEAQSDYETIKSELDVLKSVEFGNVPTDGTETLEAIMMRKNRALEAENTDLKIRSAELTERLESLETSTGTSSAKVMQQAELIAQLEADLSVLQAQSGKSGDRSGGGADASMVPIDLTDGGSGAGGGEDASLLSIVSSQRDRFRQRNIELESEARHHTQTAATLRKEIDTLRSDNVKLYEKIKFVQGYQSSNRSADDAVNKYSQAYEEKLNPFSEFSAAEKKRKLQSMNLADKLVHTVSRIVLGSSKARLVFVSYIMVLHALIFIVLLRFSHHSTGETSNVAELCMKRFANHMHLTHHKEFFEDAQDVAGGKT